VAEALALGVHDNEDLLVLAHGKAALQDGLNGSIKVWGHAVAGYRWVVREVSVVSDLIVDGDSRDAWLHQPVG
jgi:hypothetical protein